MFSQNVRFVQIRPFRKSFLFRCSSLYTTVLCYYNWFLAAAAGASCGELVSSCFPKTCVLSKSDRFVNRSCLGAHHFTQLCFVTTIGFWLPLRRAGELVFSQNVRFVQIRPFRKSFLFRCSSLYTTVLCYYNWFLAAAAGASCGELVSSCFPKTCVLSKSDRFVNCSCLGAHHFTQLCFVTTIGFWLLPQGPPAESW